MSSPTKQTTISDRIVASSILIFMLGIAATLVGAYWVANDVNDQRVAERDGGAESIVESVSTSVSEALSATERIGHFSDSTWPTVPEFEGFLASYSSALPGKTTTTVVVAVAAEDIEAFVAAERDFNPDFELSYMNEEPPNGQHLLSMRSGGSEIPLGIDLSSAPGGSERFWSLEKEILHLANRDIRQPTSEPGFLQATRRVELTGPDGVTREAWSIVQVDLQRLLGDAVEQAGAGFGASFEMVALGPGGTYGIEASDPSNSIVRSIDAGDMKLTMEAWLSDESVGRGAVTRIVAIGLTATLAFTLIGYLLLSLRINRRRAREGERDARHDPLTGLMNRRWVNEHLSDLVGEPVAVLFCDIDRFKIVNDSAGHAAGDELLIEVAARIDRVLGPNSRLARFGGDEFLVICSGEEDIDPLVETVAAQVQAAMETPFDIDGAEFRATISIGIATTEMLQPNQSEELIRAADVALGLCKQAGPGGGAVLYDDRLREAEIDRLELERDLQRSLDERDLVMYYQPIVDLDHRPVSYEALVRWRRNGALVSPASFLPVVEEIGRMSDLGDIVLNLAIADFAAGIDRSSSTTLHVNVDATQLSNTMFASQVGDLLQRHDLDPSRLVLELTEGEWVTSIDSIGAVLEGLNDLGIALAIDDFGTGHSSLARLLEVKALAEVKLDRSLIRQLFEPRNHTFFSGLTSTLVDIGLTAIAEGIETVEELRCAKEAGLGFFQGYMFARPAPIEEVDFASTARLGPDVETPVPQPPSCQFTSFAHKVA